MYENASNAEATLKSPFLVSDGCRNARLVPGTLPAVYSSDLKNVIHVLLRTDPDDRASPSDIVSVRGTIYM